MPQLRRDPIITSRWVIIAAERAKRPNDFKFNEPDRYGDGPCPFCEGNEKLTPPEVDADRLKNTLADSTGWLTRTVPNKYPALEDKPSLGKTVEGLFEMMDGIGRHEVIIESPDHNKQLVDLDIEQIRKIVQVYKRRSIELSKDERFKHILIFKNYGMAAGASLEHSHSQLISLPVIPRRVMEELECSHQYYDNNNNCIFCDIAKQEAKSLERLVYENTDFIVFCPFASRFPFEMMIIPKKHQSHFSDITRIQIDSFAIVIKETLTKIKKVLKNPAYNFIIHTNSYNGEGEKYYHWHVEIIPTLNKTAGFEWGTGFYINPTSPEAAAKYLKQS
ncbi:MAG: galactose-1-phosphate uridylyltransferase [Candidatus Omnitrophota bacterium]